MTTPDGSSPSQIAKCSDCDRHLSDPFGWCGNCRAAFCFTCGRRHFCKPTCAAEGCHAGFCVREVRNGKLSERWGLPAQSVTADSGTRSAESW